MIRSSKIHLPGSVPLAGGMILGGLYVLLAVITLPALASAQDQNGLATLSELSRHGQLPQLIQAADSLLASERLTATDQGIALTYLGHAYQQEGQFSVATACYERALAVMNRDGLHAAEYATTLGTLATLYAEMGQTETARHVLLRSARLFEEQGDYAKSAIVWGDLATMAADGDSRREAHKDMARSIAESELAKNATQDQLAALAATEARIAELDGDARSAVSEYQRSLTLWKQTHGEQHPQTGWLYVLLGGAYLQAGEFAAACEMTKQGLSVVEASSGRQSPRFFAAELAYSRALEASGARDDARALRKDAETGLNTSGRQTARDEVSVFALR